MITVSPLNGVLSRMATLGRAMDDVIGRTDESLNGQYWVPAMDAWETEHAFVVQVDLPGLKPDQVDVSFDKNTLTIRGTRSDTIPSDKEEKRVFFIERAPGVFSRTLRFPQYVEASKIEAKFGDGVLTVTVPKSDAAKPRKIAIEAN
jgi:HSP20 family protein